jgi:serine/threonine-protein phosphatase 2A regulatory subunit B
MNPLLITCNSHDAKLWRFPVSHESTWNVAPEIPGEKFPLPVCNTTDIKYAAECVRTFSDIQIEFISDIQCLNDQRSFLMIDVSCVKLWDFERDIEPVTLIRVPTEEPELTTCAVHRNWPSAFLVGDEGGDCKIFDLRQQTCDLTPSVAISTSPHAVQRMDGCDSIGSAVFFNDGNGFVIRRFGDLQAWDLRRPNAPVAKCEVQWPADHMPALIAEEIVKDQFRTAITKNGKIVSGCYQNDFVSWDWKNGTMAKHKALSPRTPKMGAETINDFTKRITVCEAHPKEEIVAVVSTAALFLFMDVGK